MSQPQQPLAEVVARLRTEQVQRWRQGERVPVEAYLQRLPRPAIVEAAVELILSEVLLREERGQAPRVEDYLRRFPQYGSRLRQQFAQRQQVGDTALLDPAGLPPVLAPSATLESTRIKPATPGDGADLVDRTAPLAGSVPAGPPPVPGYRVLRELGWGGMGVVYLAQQVKLGRLVALKMIRTGRHAGPEELARFRAEARAVALLQHPNIVQIYEVGEAAGCPFFSLEFIDGGNLANKLRGTPVPGPVAARLVGILARAVHHAHQRGIVHRDLKPANILLASGRRQSPDGPPSAGDAPPPLPLEHCTLKITDFGLAKFLEGEPEGSIPGGQTESGAVLGTPSYMAPEQAAGKTRTSRPAADVYALGAILYELLTGRPPFRAATPMETVLQVLAEDPVPPSSLQPKLPRDLETICLKCLEKDPKKRYASAQDLADDLGQFLAGGPIKARPRGRIERVWRWCRRNPVPASLLLAITLGAVFGMWYLARLSETLVQFSALQGAAQQSEMFDEVNTFYSDHVVDRATRVVVQPSLGARTVGLAVAPSGPSPFAAVAALLTETSRSGVEATHRYRSRPWDIPVPATFTIELGQQISKHSTRGMQVRVYSDSPFRTRKGGGAQDDFERAALRSLKADPQTPYYQFEDFHGRPVLRYATARLMQESCLGCHNSHPDNPRHNWKVGELRGVLEIVRPLDRDVARTQEGLRGSIWLVAGLFGGLVVLSSLILFLSKRRRGSTDGPAV